MRRWGGHSCPPLGRQECLPHQSQVSGLNSIVSAARPSIERGSARRGDCWLATLCWTRIIEEPTLFVCPGTDDFGVITEKQPVDLRSADTIAPDAISYAGLCSGLAGRFARRSTRNFCCTGVSTASALACDDNEGPNNHEDGLNVVYFDSHVEFRQSEDGAVYAEIGKRGADPPEFQWLDSGESALAAAGGAPTPRARAIPALEILAILFVIGAAAFVLRRPVGRLLGLRRAPEEQADEE